MTLIALPAPASCAAPGRRRLHRRAAVALLSLTVIAACGNVEFVNEAESEIYRVNGQSFRIEQVSSHRYVPGAFQTEQNRGPFDYSYMRINLPDGTVRRCGGLDDCRRIAREFAGATTRPATSETVQEGGNDGSAGGHAD